jgi:penicillin-binding protein 1A
MTDILKDVIKSGTGRNAAVKGIELAGKTGTTNKNVDAWFCGYSPTIEAIIWFGRDNNKPIGKGATGGAISAPAFSYFYRKLIKEYPETKRSFDIPQEVYKGTYEGRTELYTKISPLPDSQMKKNDSVITMSDEDDGYTVDDDYVIDDGEGMDPEEDIGMADTINIDEDPNEIIEDSDPLHPRRKVPAVPVSNDSGTMF